MEQIDALFFELIRVAFGFQDRLSYSPSDEEWQNLYLMAKKQAIVGICFKAIEALPEHQVPVIDILADWIGTADYICARNEILNKEIVYVYEKLKTDGLNVCILKGQSLVRFYPNRLECSRQCGDIDVLADKDDIEVLKYAYLTEGKDMKWSYKHVHFHILKSTYVDLHYRMAMSRNLWRNRKIQTWCKELKRNGFTFDEKLGYATLYDKDNVVFLLLHTMWHFLYEGVGLRQVMDLYFIVSSSRFEELDLLEINTLLNRFKLKKFASACSWVMWHVFEGEKEGSHLLTTNSALPLPSKREGVFLLEEIMFTGNFGHYDKRFSFSKNDRVLPSIWKKIIHYSRYSRHYPFEFLWVPLGTLYIRMWKNKTIKKLGFSIDT